MNYLEQMKDLGYIDLDDANQNEYDWAIDFKESIKDCLKDDNEKFDDMKVFLKVRELYGKDDADIISAFGLFHIYLFNDEKVTLFDSFIKPLSDFEIRTREDFNDILDIYQEFEDDKDELNGPETDIVA